MRVRHVIALGALATLFSLTGVGTAPAVGSGSVPRVASPSVVVADCDSKPQIRPANFVRTCADYNDRFTGLRWTSWGPVSAVATGNEILNDCTPDCASGTFHTYRARVVFENPRPWRGHPGLRRYTTIRIVYPGTRPPDTPRQVTYPLGE
jgi:hypothetical protein